MARDQMDEDSSGGSRAEGGFDIDDARAARIEPDDDLDGWVADLDLSLAVEREGARAEPEGTVSP